jgi:Ca2+-binding RTX toxin-like protein
MAVANITQTAGGDLSAMLRQTLTFGFISGGGASNGLDYLEYRDLGGEFVTRILGTGYTYGQNGQPIAGTVTRIEVYLAGEATPLAVITDISSALPNFATQYYSRLSGYQISYDATASGAGVGFDGFNGLDTLTGSNSHDRLGQSPFGNNAADTLIGLKGNDSYYLDVVGDVIVEELNGGVDTVYSSITSQAYTLGANLERLTLIDNAFEGVGNGLNNLIHGNGWGNVLSGKDGADTIFGNDGDDSMLGEIGDDSLLGGLGRDTMDGGAGADTMRGGADDDLYYLVDAGDLITEVAGGGYDEVQASRNYTLTANVEKLVLTGTATTGVGNASENVVNGNDLANLLQGLDGADEVRGFGGNDTLLGGNHGDVLRGDDGLDSLNGGEGADSLSGDDEADTLNGGAGADSMSGGLGDDTYYVDSGSDTTFEFMNSGTDTVISSVTRVLGAELENLTLIGGALNGGGNGLANVMKGNANNNLLRGYDGADTIVGGEGADSLSGGAGRDQVSGGAGEDRFLFAAGDFAGLTSATADRIIDFVIGQDKIDVSLVDANETVGGNQAFTFIGSGLFSQAGQVRAVVSGGITLITGNTDMDADAEFMIRLDGVLALTGTDFVL